MPHESGSFDLGHCVSRSAESRFVSNLTGIDAGRIRIGIRVANWWDDIGEDMFLPHFCPIDAGDAHAA